jgi:hypothetical protein
MTLRSTRRKGKPMKKVVAEVLWLIWFALVLVCEIAQHHKHCVDYAIIMITFALLPVQLWRAYKQIKEYIMYKDNGEQ